MANNVFANGREIACKAADGKSICAFPDVCFTPPQTPATPPGVPIPYPNTVFAKDSAQGSKKVKISGKEVMLKNKSYFKTSTGNEAGSAPKKGIMTSKIKGKAYFNAWSMDVKIEGQNVVRHLDLTTHNHGSNTNTGPWLYGDSSAFAPGGACNKKPPKDYANQVKENCTNPADEPWKDTTPDCCDARRCMMVPYRPNHCCEKNNVQMTPHHPLPFQDHYPTGTRNLPKAKWKPLTGKYDGDKAPCICAEGRDHGYGSTGVIQQHGRIGRTLAYYRDKILEGKNYKYEQINKKTGEVVGKVTGCDADCIQAQMDEYHIDRVEATGDLRKSRQARKGGKEMYEENMPTD